MVCVALYVVLCACCAVSNKVLCLWIRIVGNSNKIKPHSENKIFLIPIFKNKTSITLKSDFLWPYIWRQPPHKIWTFSSFFCLYFWSIFWDEKGKLLQFPGIWKNVSFNTWVSSAQLCHLVAAQTQWYCFKTWLFYSQVLSLYEFHRFPI